MRVNIPNGATAKRRHRFSFRASALSIFVLLCSGGLSAYSVLTHDEIVDLLWADEIRPLLLNRFPGLTEDQIKEAHAYAYGGAVIQDLGYSDLLTSRLVPPPQHSACQMRACD